MEYLMFLWSIRSLKSQLYILSIEKFLLRIFAFDQMDYAHQLSIHQYEMLMLNETNREIYQKLDEL